LRWWDNLEEALTTCKLIDELPRTVISNKKLASYGTHRFLAVYNFN
jgi:hypothetical protein